MAKAARKTTGQTRRTSTTISRGNVPIGDTNMVPPPPPVPRADPTPEEQEKLLKRGTLMAVLYAELGSYRKVADLFDVAESTVRWWVHQTRKQSKEALATIAQQLRGDVAQLAVDRVQEGLLEGQTEFAAMLGAKVLHGLGELKAHSAVKNDHAGVVTTLTLNITRSDPTIPVPDIVEGAVLGRPRELAAAQTSADVD
jgi:transposase